jgi:alkanesulfonate monooxygenase SsuD/methylene tetrahydromethanopterin reductase-like flavin-dependent oxidoreductase (luciferase family)
VRLVRPPGLLDSLGLVLPTIPWDEFPAQNGSTLGVTCGGTSGTTQRLAHLASEAENLGASSLWACDHLFWHQPLLEPLTSLAVAAGATTTALLGTCVLQLPLRDPVSVARQAATLQTLSGGRFVLGLGVGSHSGEYDAAGVDFSRRGQLLDEGLDTLRDAWRSAGDPGRRYRLEPATAPIPIWVGGSSEAAISRAARTADGWIPMFTAPADFAARKDRLLELAAAAGRDEDAIETAVVVMACVGDSAEVARKAGTTWLADLYDLPPKAFERHLVAGPPEDCAAELEAYCVAGAAQVVVMVAADETLEHFGALAEARATGGSPATFFAPTPPSAPE